MSDATVAPIYRLESYTLSAEHRLVFPSDYRTPLIGARGPCEALERFVALAQAQGVPFRRELSHEGFGFLVSYHPSEKIFRVASRRLGRELSLLHALELEGKAHPELLAHATAMSTLNADEFPSEWQWLTRQESLSPLSGASFGEVEKLTDELLRQLVRHVSAYRPTLFERVSDWGLSLTAQFALIRVHLLKFLALLPSLDHDKKGGEVKRNLVECLRRLLQDDRQLRRAQVSIGGTRALARPIRIGVMAGLWVARILPAWPLAQTVRALVKKMAKRFIAGESIASSDKTLLGLAQTRRDATLDQLGELVVSEEEADEYLRRVLAIVHGLKVHIQPGEKNAAGIPKAHVSIKVSALASDFRPQAYAFTYDLVAPRLRQILVEARREQVFVNIDAEHYHYRDLVLKIYRQVLLETPELAGWGDTGIVLQAYLRDGAQHLRDILALARERGVRMPIRLVKGAYWDAETIEATVHSHHAPQFLNKEESDLHFRQLAYEVLRHPQELQLALAGHNLQDHCFVEALRRLRFPEAPVIEHQCLHMTYEALSHGLAKMGWPTRNYMPIGNLLVGMAYLVRRIMENSSQVGILTIMRSHNKRDAFGPPLVTHQKKLAGHELVRDALDQRLESGFKNVTPLRLFIEAERESFVRELKALEAQLREAQATLAQAPGAKIFSNSHPELVVGAVVPATASAVEQVAREFYHGMKAGNGWTELPRSARLAVLYRAADRLWYERQRLAALIVFEAGKSWGEALADVDEAIDFVNFYAKEELRWTQELKEAQPRGVTAVIAPWNFPLAIPCGMAVAPLAAGNPVILKPAEQTPLIARELVEILHWAGVPKTALFFAPGDGEAVGAPLVRSEYVSTIVFTGSKSVGQWIYQTASVQQVNHPLTGILMFKRVITEMGGKNAIVVTNNCEQDETVSGILYAAFAHAGQKCSACSRVLVDEEVKASLMERLVRAVNDLEVGVATAPHVLVNPLVTKEDQERVRRIVREAVAEAEAFGGKVWVNRAEENNGGTSVGPVVIELPVARARHPESWAQREIFGPVIHVIGYHTLSEAVELFNSTEYGLTGGVYAQSQDDVDYLLRELRCGNLYINRPNTGARVAIEPFGGFKLSGTGPKAGGRDYLAQFLVPAEVLKAPRPASSTFQWAKERSLAFERPRPIQLSLSGRLLRWQRLGERVLAQYESLTGGIGEGQKQALQDFVRQMPTLLPHELTAQHPNLKIPGQLSYDRKDLTRESVALVVSRREASLPLLLHWLSAIAAGSGVAVLATTSESYATWKALTDLAHKAGLSQLNVEAYLCDQASLKEALAHEGLDAVVLSAELSASAELVALVMPQSALKLTMRQLFHESEHPPLSHWRLWLEQYLLVRSLAVNTMRHGAPLELHS